MFFSCELLGKKAPLGAVWCGLALNQPAPALWRWPVGAAEARDKPGGELGPASAPQDRWRHLTGPAGWQDSRPRPQGPQARQHPGRQRGQDLVWPLPSVLGVARPLERSRALPRSDAIQEPEIPQALRLQGILIGAAAAASTCVPAAAGQRPPPAVRAGGIVVIFDMQQGFLLEDCNDVVVCAPPRFQRSWRCILAAPS